ncbi:hypothetical protein Tco_0952020 [Tanacetum coccineum]|uniref:Uncharacterized protein n=1 Tax=Tanacetum coccineum TaxID=301880 RepID=A0ABQ5DVW9_9ASTR
MFNILADLRPELPDRNAIIKDSSEGKIGMYTCFIEFANFWIPLSKFLLSVLEYYQINLSQLSVIGAAKNNHFFCIDASVCPLSIPWFSGTSVVKDPLPVDEVVDLPCVELLNENRTIIRKYPKVFLCLVGISRSFTKSDVHPTLLCSDDEEISLLDFVNSMDPFKVKTGEQTLAKNEVLLLTETEDRVISPSSKTISLVDYTIQDEMNVNVGKRKKRLAFVSGSPPVKKARTEGIIIFDSRPSTRVKSPTALRRLIRQSGQVNVGSGSVVPAAEEITSPFVTPTPEHAPKDDLRDNVVTRVSLALADVSVPVIDPASDAHGLSGAGLEVGTLSATWSQGSSTDDFYESQTVDSATTLNILLDHVTPLGYWAALRNQGDVGFLDAFNINSAQHICMASELRHCYKHEIMTREKFMRKFTDSAAIVQQRDAEVADLKARLERFEAEAAKVVKLRKRVCNTPKNVS